MKSGEVPQLQITPDRVALVRHGMHLGDFQHFFQTAVGRRPASELWDGERRFDVVMHLPLESPGRSAPAPDRGGGAAMNFGRGGSSFVMTTITGLARRGEPAMRSVPVVHALIPATPHPRGPA